MGSVLVDDQEFALILYHPVCLKDLADHTEGRSVVLEHYLRVAVITKICIFEQTGLFEDSFGRFRLPGRLRHRSGNSSGAFKVADPLVHKEKVFSLDTGRSRRGRGFRVCKVNLQ